MSALFFHVYLYAHMTRLMFVRYACMKILLYPFLCENKIKGW